MQTNDESIAEVKGQATKALRRMSKAKEALSHALEEIDILIQANATNPTLHQVLTEIQAKYTEARVLFGTGADAVLDGNNMLTAAAEAATHQRKRGKKKGDGGEELAAR